MRIGLSGAYISLDPFLLSEALYSSIASADGSVLIADLSTLYYVGIGNIIVCSYKIHNIYLMCPTTNLSLIVTYLSI